MATSGLHETTIGRATTGFAYDASRGREVQSARMSDSQDLVAGVVSLAPDGPPAENTAVV